MAKAKRAWNALDQAMGTEYGVAPIRTPKGNNQLKTTAQNPIALGGWGAGVKRGEPEYTGHFVKPAASKPVRYSGERAESLSGMKPSDIGLPNSPAIKKAADKYHKTRGKGY